MIFEYEIKKPIGRGYSGFVFEAKNIKNEENVAIKCIFKIEGNENLNKDIKNEVINEINILKLIENDYSIKLLDYFEDSVAYYLVEELLFDNFEKYINEHELTRENIKKFIKQFCIAYSKLLEYNIEHKDIKEKNILINNEFDIKLCDYNFSKIHNIYNIYTNTLTIKSNKINFEHNNDLKNFCNILLKILSKNKNECEDIYNLINDIINGKKEKSWKDIFEFVKVDFPREKKSFKKNEIKFPNKLLLENFKLKSNTNEYKILSGIGKGGFGIVVKALDSKKEKIVAIKLFLNFSHIDKLYDEDELKRTEYEEECNKMKIVMDNKYFVKVLDESLKNKENIFYFIVMEYIASNLEIEFNNNRIIRDNDIRKILHQLLDGIKFMRERNIIHRDLKLNNILLDIIDLNTYNYNIKIADFGCAKVGTSFSSNQVGSPLYQPPELLNDENKKFSEKVDVWSFGVIVFLFEQKHFPFNSNDEIQHKDLDNYFKMKNNFFGQIIFLALNKNYNERPDWNKLYQLDYFKKFKFDSENFIKEKYLEKKNIFNKLYASDKSRYKEIENDKLNKYYGLTLNGKKHGSGFLFYCDTFLTMYGIFYNDNIIIGHEIGIENEQYKGEYKNNNYNGFGIYEFVDGTQYIGEYKDNLKNGYGITLRNFKISKELYDFIWNKNNFNIIQNNLINEDIKKILLYSNKEDNEGSNIVLLYFGYWENNKITFTTFISRDGIYQGEYNDTDSVMEGIHYNINGDYYIGQWKNNLRNGFGCYYHYKIKHKYVGEWENGQRNGFGIFNNGKTKIVSQFKNDAINGIGKAKYDETGRKYLGDWENNKSVGYGIIIYNEEDDEKEFEGEWKNDSKNGIGILSYKNGDYYIGEWEYDKKQGIGILLKNKKYYKGRWNKDELVDEIDDELDNKLIDDIIKDLLKKLKIN